MKLRIRMLGNINNYPLRLAVGLRSLGHDVRVGVTRTERLHRPESMYPEWAHGYPPWISDLSEITEEQYLRDSSALAAAAEWLNDGSDLIILNDYALSLAERIEAPHVALLTGADLHYYADFSMLGVRTKGWDPAFTRSVEGRRWCRDLAHFVARQRDGIAAACVVGSPLPGLQPRTDSALVSLGVTEGERIMCCMSDVQRLESTPLPARGRLRILSGARVVFRRDHGPEMSEYDLKGTDTLLHGFAGLVRSGRDAELVLPRKGQDVAEAERMVRELGITGHVEWLDEVSLAAFQAEMIRAHIVCDQFGSTFPAMVTMDAYALGRPVMANMRNDVFGRCFPEPLPGWDLREAAQVTDALIDLHDNHAEIMQMATRSRRYAEAYLSPGRNAQDLVELVLSKRSRSIERRRAAQRA